MVWSLNVVKVEGQKHKTVCGYLGSFDEVEQTAKQYITKYEDEGFMTIQSTFVGDEMKVTVKVPTNYQTLKDYQQKRFNAFDGIFFAFSNEQLHKGMKKVGAKKHQDILFIGAGGFLLKSKRDDYRRMNRVHDQQMKRAFESDEFLYSMFDYELANHEYGVTYDLQDTLDALGITKEHLRTNDRMQKQLNKALKKYWEGN